MMDDSPRLYISEYGEDEDMEEEEEGEMREDRQEETDTFDADHDYVYPQDARLACQTVPVRRGEDGFGITKSSGVVVQPSTHDQTHRHHNTRQALRPTDAPGYAMQTVDNFSQSASSAPVAPCGYQVPAINKQGDLDESHSCKYCQKAFNTHTNTRRHERRIHEQHLRLKRRDKTQQERSEGVPCVSQPQPQLNAAALASGEQAAQYMLDVSGSISENLSIYIDGKIVSTSTVSSCELVDVNSGSSHIVGLDTLILDPAQISQALNSDVLLSKEVACQPLAKRRTATPPLLPQIKTQLESEVIVSSSTASLVSTLIENLLPQSTDPTVLQKEKTVFVSPKLKQILEKQDGLKPTLALIADGQKRCSPLSLSVLPAGAGRFKRRTGTPPTSPQQSSTSDLETGDSECVIVVHNNTQHTTRSEDTSTPPVKEPATSHESWPSITGGNSCNQQPLDLSNAVKRNEGVGGLAEAVLDLSLQKRQSADPLVKKGKPNACVLERVLLSEYAVHRDAQRSANPGVPLVTDVAVVTGSDLASSVRPLVDGLVYGLALPAGSLAPPPSSLAPVALRPACAITLASPAAHALLPAAPSLITVLAPPASVSDPSNQAIQVLTPDGAPEPLVFCAESAISPSECDLAAAFSATNSANLVTLTQPLDAGLHLPGHVFLADPIALNTGVLERTVGSEVPFSPTVTLNDSLLNSYNITSNTVLIECTIALDAPGNIVPAAIAVQENTVERLAPTQIVINPDPQTVDPTVLVSSVAESVTLSTSSAAEPECPVVDAPPHGPEPDDHEGQLPPPKEEQPAGDDSSSTPDMSAETPPPPEPADVKESPNNAVSDDTSQQQQQQTFARNFACNVCATLFHSMKELGQHVGEHAEGWPYKCEFCVLLFGTPSDLLEHRSKLHGVGATYLCSACTKEFVYLCNLKHHQEELHPGQQCTYTEEENGKLRPPNYNSAAKVTPEASASSASDESEKAAKKEKGDVDTAAEELLTTIKILASDGGKGHNVRLGLNQHYPSFKPPPFPYHNRSPAGSMASATNFTTHNIPQTFSTAIRCTKCGKSFDNMPELHKHILSCANASDKRRYTPKKNPIPLRHFAKAQNGVLSSTNSTNGLNGSHHASQGNRSKHYQEPVKLKLGALSKKKKRFIQRAMSQRYKSAAASNKTTSSASDEREVFACSHCSREFTLRRSRTKHMAVCPKKHKASRSRKDVGVSVTKENNGNLRRGATHLEDKRQASAQDRKDRVQPSSPAKRPAILPVQTLLSAKKSEIVIKETPVPLARETPVPEPPVSRTFSPSMRQYGRVQHGGREMPVKITLVKPPQSLGAWETREKPQPSATDGLQQNAASFTDAPMTTRRSPDGKKDPVV